MRKKKENPHHRILPMNKNIIFILFNIISFENLLFSNPDKITEFRGLLATYPKLINSQDSTGNTLLHRYRYMNKRLNKVHSSLDLSNSYRKHIDGRSQTL